MMGASPLIVVKLVILNIGGGTICVIATDSDKRIEYAITNPRNPINVNKYRCDTQKPGRRKKNQMQRNNCLSLFSIHFSRYRAMPIHTNVRMDFIFQNLHGFWRCADDDPYVAFGSYSKSIFYFYARIHWDCSVKSIIDLR